MSLVEKKVFIIFFFALGLFLWSGNSAWAADFGLSSSKTTYEVGEAIPVRIYIASPGQASNAVSGVVSFSADRLQVSSLSKTSSVINMWVQEPSYFNSDGQVNFEGVVLNPGYTGGAGTVLTINFKARTAGPTKITFANGSILANDGEGTNILKKLGQLSLTIVPATAKKTAPAVAPKANIKTPGQVSTTTVLADTYPPEQLAIVEIESTSPKKARFSFSASDSQSGIDFYQFSVDDRVVGRLPYGANVYETPEESVGVHSLKIVVTDKAGNQTEETVNFEISSRGFAGLSLPFAGNAGLFIIILLAGLFILLILIALIILLKSLRRLFALEKELSHKAREVEPRFEAPAPKPYQEGPLSTAKIIFRGQSEATQAVVLLRNGQIVAETKPGADNVFEFTIDNLTPGLQHFAVVALEALGNPALTQDYPVMLSAGASIVVSGVDIKLPRVVPLEIKNQNFVQPVENFVKKDINYPEPNV